VLGTKRLWDAQEAADLPRDHGLDLLMAWDRCGLLFGLVHIEGVPTAFTQHFASVGFQVPD